MASKLTPKQLETRDFILSVFRKEAPASKATLKKLMKVYTNTDNQEITREYGDQLISSFLSVYKFKSYKDYKEILSILQNAVFYDTGLTYYGNFNNIITKKLFENTTLKNEWVIENMTTAGSFAEINNIIGFVYTNEKDNLIDTLLKIVDDVRGYVKDIIVYAAIIRHGMSRNVKGLDTVFEKIFETGLKLEIDTIERRYHDINNKDIKAVIGNYLYMVTNNEEYLPEEAKNVFIF